MGAVRNVARKVVNVDQMSHPVQPIGFAEQAPGRGQLVVRFKENAIVRHLLDFATSKGLDLNKIAMAVQGVPTCALPVFSREDYEQLMQLIGYSICGYSEISDSNPHLVSKRSADDAWDEAQRIQGIARPTKKKKGK